MKYQSQRGTRDILPSETPLWQKVEAGCQKLFFSYGYQEIRTPIFEATELFTRTIGEGTDIVSKEMYTFNDKGDRSITLRPEATACVVRAGIENNLLSPDQVTKLWYLGPMFRYERPQAGRQRQFHQAGVEAFGSPDPLLDAEVIILAVKLLETLGVGKTRVLINSVGCKKCRPAYEAALKEYLKKNQIKLCAKCQERMEKNPLRALDCKEGQCQEVVQLAPHSVDFLDPECRAHFDKLLIHLKSSGIVFEVSKRLVRGLDYYTRTTFEITSADLGAQDAICGGGRYDDLVKELGGRDVPAVGFALGMERLVQLLMTNPSVIAQLDQTQGLDVYLCAIGAQAQAKAFDLMQQIRGEGKSADMDFSQKSLKSQLKAADRFKARKTIILGEEELKRGVYLEKNMQSGEQIEKPI